MVSGEQDENCQDTALAPEPIDDILGKLAEASNRGDPYQSQISLWVWSKEDSKILLCSFLPKFRWAEKKMCVLLGLPIEANKFALEYPLVVDSFSPRDTYCLLVCLVLYPENLTWQLSGWGPQNTARQKYRLHPICIWLGSCQLFPALRGIAFVSVILEW